MHSFHDRRWGNLEWSEWLPLDASIKEYRQSVTTNQGIYRVRSSENQGLIYIGQTGRSLRERTRALSCNVYRAAELPPWNDPHTAAPGLWAWRIESGLHYELSVAQCQLEKPERLCKEDELLFLHRVEIGESTLCNHGRFHALWSRPTNRSRGVVMRRLNGNKNSAGESSLAPVKTHGNPTDHDWLMLPWEETRSLSDSSFPSVAGVYRLTRSKRVIYLGETLDLGARLKAHARRFGNISASFVTMEDALPHHLKERETDLIGAHYHSHGRPEAQWIPSSSVWK